MPSGSVMQSGNGSKSRDLKPVRGDIQGLRAFAVLVVFAQHLFGWPQGGFVGVDIFFVISGFLITGLLLREHDRTGKVSFVGFYKRRIRRILPASLSALIATVALAWVVLPTPRAMSTSIDALWALVFAGNWRFASNGTDYFQEGTPPSPLQHFWSLGVEEQFYFVWPWLMVLIFLVSAKVFANRLNTRLLIAGTLLIIVVWSFIFSLQETATNPTWAYFSTFSRAWELGIGALLAVTSEHLVRLPRRVRTSLTQVGLVCMVASLFLVNESAGFPAPTALLPAVATACVIAAGTGSEAKRLSLLVNPISNFIGNISFSLYLWHWPVIVLLVSFLPAHNFEYYVLALALSFALAVLSFHFIEEPFRKGKSSRASLDHGRRSRDRVVSRTVNAQTVLASLIVLSLCAVGFMFLSSDLVSSNTSDSTQADSSGTATHQLGLPACIGAEALRVDAHCDKSPTGTVSPSIDKMGTDTGSSFDCWRAEGEEFKDCSLGSDASNTFKIALVGDSHAASLIPGLKELVEKGNIRIDLFVGWGCQWMEFSPDSNCYGPMKKVQDKLLRGEYDAVITTAGRNATPTDKSNVAKLFAKAWQPVVDNGTKIIAIADVPAPSEESLACLARVGFKPATSTCGTDENDALSTVDPLIEASAIVKGVHVIDLAQYFCFNGQCPAIIGNTIVYRDSAGHITASYATSLAPILTAEVMAALQLGE